MKRKSITGRFGAVALLAASMVLNACLEYETASEILKKTIHSIDTIESVSYTQDMWRTDPQNPEDTIFRYREMQFKRLIADSLVGVKGHWYMYGGDRSNLLYEDIYDGERLIRKNNRDSFARVYDLDRYPEFRRKPFWGHNTPYGMQHEFRYILSHRKAYSISRLRDTVIEDWGCFQLQVILKDHSTMPGFAIDLQEQKGSVSRTLYFIEKDSYFPKRMKGESYNTDNPEQKFFIDQIYNDIRLNSYIDEDLQFNTSDQSIAAYKRREMTP